MKDFLRNIVILDRDGVINEHKKPYVINYKQFRVIKNSLRGIYKLHKKKFLIAIATNQSCVGRKIVSKKVIEKIHSQFLKNLKKIYIKIYELSVCYHHPLKNCKCRKPKTGLKQKVLMNIYCYEKIRDIKKNNLNLPLNKHRQWGLMGKDLNIKVL